MAIAWYDSVEEMLEDESMIVKFDRIEDLSYYQTICGNKDAYSLWDMIYYIQTKELLPHQYTLIGIVDKNKPLLIALVILHYSLRINIDWKYIEDLVKNKWGSLIYDNYDNYKSGCLFFVSK